MWWYSIKSLVSSLRYYVTGLGIPSAVNSNVVLLFRSLKSGSTKEHVEKNDLNGGVPLKVYESFPALISSQVCRRSGPETNSLVQFQASGSCG